MPYLTRSKSKEIIPGVEEGKTFVFWKIIFEVQRDETGSPSPMLYKEVSIWKIPLEIGIGMPEQIFGKKIKKLPDPIVNGNVQYVYDPELRRCKAVFNGGYLGCKDSSLKQDLEELFTMKNSELNGRSIQNDLGYNIGVRADFKLTTITEPRAFPLFYYPQPDEKAISFLEKGNSNVDHFIDWSVGECNGSQRQKTSNSFKEPKGWHNLVVSQDRDAAAMGNACYEFQVDGVSLQHVELEPNENTAIPFTPEKQIDFLIGGVKNGNSQVVPLTGEICRLEFDPNDTCWTC